MAQSAKVVEAKTPAREPSPLVEGKGAPPAAALIVPTKAPVNHLKWFVRYFSNDNGRDKFNKFVQYAAQLAAYRNLTLAAPTKDKALETSGQQWRGLSVFMANCRRLERLFKGIYEIDKLVDIAKSPNPSPTANALNVLTRLGFMGFWTFDNLKWLQVSKFVVGNDEWGRYSAIGWWVGLFGQILLDLLAFRETIRQEQELTGSPAQAQTDKLRALRAKRTDLSLSIARNLCDLVVAGNAAKFHEHLGFSLKDDVTGVCGVSAALIAAYQVALATKP